MQVVSWKTSFQWFDVVFYIRCSHHSYHLANPVISLYYSNNCMKEIEQTAHRYYTLHEIYFCNIPFNSWTQNHIEQNHMMCICDYIDHKSVWSTPYMSLQLCFETIGQTIPAAVGKLKQRYFDYTYPEGILVYPKMVVRWIRIFKQKMLTVK